MTLNYKELKPLTVELANITEDNIKMGVLPTPLTLIPAFIMPNNKIYYMTTDHFSANFFEELEKSLEILGEKPIISLSKPEEPKEHLISLKNNLINDYQRFLNNDISAGDVRNYLNMNCLEIFKYNPFLKNLYSLDCRKVLLMLLESKIQIYDYFLKLMENSNDIKRTLKTHPYFNHNISTYKDAYEKSKKMLETCDDLEYKMVLNVVMNTFHDLSKNELMDLITNEFMKDFAVSTIGFDKIETQVNNTITTTKMNPYEFYFNYLIMGYNVVQIPKVIFDNKKQSFIITDTNEYSLAAHYDKKYKEEADLIKRKVPYSERYKYFI